MRYKTILKLAISVSLALAPAISHAADVATPTKCEADAKASGGCECDKAMCVKALDESDNKDFLDMKGIDTGAGQNDGANKLIAECKSQADRIATARKECDRAHKVCTDESNPKNTNKAMVERATTALKELDDKEKGQMKMVADLEAANATCATGAQDVADATKGDGDNKGGGGGGMNPMMMMAAGAAIGGIMGYMMSKKDEKKKDEDEEETDDALLPTGILDCEKSDAYQYADCDKHLSQICAGAAAGGSSTSLCTGFVARYCNTLNKPITNDKAQSQPAGNNVELPVTMGGTGTGVGTPFCKLGQNQTFCAGVSAEAKPFCPSCKPLEKNPADICAANPALCMPQYSKAGIAEAQEKCPSDPAFSDPKFVAGGSQVPAELVPDGGLPDPVVYTGGGSSSGSAGTGTTSTVPVIGSVQQSAQSVGQQAQGASKIASGGMGAQSVSNGGSAEVEDAGGIFPARAVASTVNPAPDVQGAYGPSLFSVSQKGLRSWCEMYKVDCNY